VYLLLALVPGLLWFSYGVGLLLFGLALAAAYALNLLGVALALREARR